MPKWLKEQFEVVVAKLKAKQLPMRKAAGMYSVHVK